MTILLFLIISYILLSLTLYWVFPKANVEGWKGLVPGLNFAEWAKIIGRKPLYALWLLFPIVNIFIFCGMAVDLVRSFGLYDFKHSALAVIYAPAIFAYIGKNKEIQYGGPTLVKEKEYREQLEQAKANNQSRLYKKLEANNPYKKSSSREWTEAIVFAVFAAAFIRMFLIEAYKIPTPSMEGSLLVGDFLFVSKAHYGIRTPMTPTMIPLLHNRIPILNKESYLEKPSLPYYRLPKLETIDRNEPFVFNWPVGDSVILAPARSWAIGQVNRGETGIASAKKMPVITRPIDKRDHYIKRCIATPGDTLQIIDREIFINGEKAVKPSGVQYLYEVTSKTGFNKSKLEDKGINMDYFRQGQNRNIFFLTDEQKEWIQSLSSDISIEHHNFEINPTQPGANQEAKKYFPHDPVHFPGWTVDNYGPIVMPKKGVTVQLTAENIALYERVINVYEHNESYERRGNQFLVNGKPITEYTFKQDYYWAMGDNRHNSEDSRMWGYVPEDHIVGKPLFIWFSTKKGDFRNGINWKRIFSSANKM